MMIIFLDDLTITTLVICYVVGIPTIYFGSLYFLMTGKNTTVAKSSVEQNV